jgi:hypothetical protein
LPSQQELDDIRQRGLEQTLDRAIKEIVLVEPGIYGRVETYSQRISPERSS